MCVCVSRCVCVCVCSNRGRGRCMAGVGQRCRGRLEEVQLAVPLKPGFTEEELEESVRKCDLAAVVWADASWVKDL